MSDQIENTLDEIGKDIVFDCPYCGKSLAIDSRGAGLTITCPDCAQSVQVPGLPMNERGVLDAGAGEEEVEPGDADDRIRILTDELHSSQAKVERLVDSLEEVRGRRRYLEKLRTDNMARFEQIGKELVTIQNAMDRIVGMIQDARTEGSKGGAEVQE